MSERTASTPARHGVNYTLEEEFRILNMWLQGADTRDIASSVQRLESAVLARIGKWIGVTDYQMYGSEIQNQSITHRQQYQDRALSRLSREAKRQGKHLPTVAASPEVLQAMLVALRHQEEEMLKRHTAELAAVRNKQAEIYNQLGEPYVQPVFDPYPEALEGS